MIHASDAININRVRVMNVYIIIVTVIIILWVRECGT